MDDDRKAKAMTRLKAASERVRAHDAERTELADAIVEALKAGWRPGEVADETPYDRNHVRRVAAAAGVPPLPRTDKPKRTKPHDGASSSSP